MTEKWPLQTRTDSVPKKEFETSELWPRTNDISSTSPKLFIETHPTHTTARSKSSQIHEKESHLPSSGQ